MRTSRTLSQFTVILVALAYSLLLRDAALATGAPRAAGIDSGPAQRQAEEEHRYVGVASGIVVRIPDGWEIVSQTSDQSTDVIVLANHHSLVVVSAGAANGEEPETCVGDVFESLANSGVVGRLEIARDGRGDELTGHGPRGDWAIYQGQLKESIPGFVAAMPGDTIASYVECVISGASDAIYAALVITRAESFDSAFSGAEEILSTVHFQSAGDPTEDNARPASESAGSETSTGVINANSTLLYRAPSILSGTIAVMEYGTEVVITGPVVLDDMYPYQPFLPITLPDGTSGFVYEAFVDRAGRRSLPRPEGQSGVITATGVFLLSIPSYLGTSVATLEAGTRVIITGPPTKDFVTGSVYVPVALENGSTGWVPIEYVAPD